jgi:poly(ribitol-phosphate) beta-N-acetylglucosaminyltransferase
MPASSLNTNTFDSEPKEKISLSCPALHHEIYLGPDEVRTCCKRFFVAGEKKGDVVLKKIKPDEAVTTELILTEKQKLLNKINNGEKNDCDGCPFLEKKEWPELTTLSVKHISFEHHSVCNMKCTYCDEIYYGGQKPNYNVSELITDLFDKGALSSCKSVVWGGGEPGIGKNFSELINEVSDKLALEDHRVLTNALEYNGDVKKLLDSGALKITTSIDAGFKETFATVRGHKGKSGLHKVLSNLKSYAESNPQNVIIKYIFTESNTSLSELAEFCENIKKYKLLDCPFQLSYDFERENVSADDLVSLIYLRQRLIGAGAHNVFFDDLLWMRIGAVYEANQDLIVNRLIDLNINDSLADPSRYSRVTVWGAGQLAVDLISNAHFFKTVHIEYFVDSDPSKWGTQFLGKEVHDPRSLLENNYPVIISAAQFYPSIIESTRKLNINSSRIIKDLIL